MQTFRRSWKIGLFVMAAMAGGASLAHASLNFDLRAVSATGSGITLNGPKSVDVLPGSTGEIVFEAWATLLGNDALKNNDKLQNWSLRFKSTNASGGGIRGNMNITPILDDDGNNIGLGGQGGWEQGTGAEHGTLRDLDGDGDMDVGNTDAVDSGGTATGNANGRHPLPPAYPSAGALPAASWMIYKFAIPITQSTPGNTMVALVPSAIPTSFLWQEDRTGAGFVANRNGVDFPVLNGPAVQVSVIPEPGTIALAIFGLAGVALAIRRRKS